MLIFFKPIKQRSSQIYPVHIIYRKHCTSITDIYNRQTDINRDLRAFILNF